MATPDLETIAMRAVEVTITGRDDPRLLVATKRTLSKPTKVARLLAALLNAADGRRVLLLVGMRRRELHGIDDLPDDDWWDELEAGFPGRVPHWDWAGIDIDGAQVLVIAPEPSDELTPAYDGRRVAVPFYDQGGIRYARPHRLERAITDGLPTAAVLGGWLERSVIDVEGLVEAYRGEIELELRDVTGSLPDKDCSATLLMSGRAGPIELDLQIHPAPDDVGVFRHADGIEIRNTFRARVLLAAATPVGDRVVDAASVQLVVSLLLPGRAVPELRSLLMSPDPHRPHRWVV